MKRSLVILLASALSAVLLSAGEAYPLRRLEVEDGLSQNMVYCILQDRDDFLWFGTQNGLDRYDGSSFRPFKKSRTPGLENDAICSIAEAPDGSIWVGTLQGLFRYHPDMESFEALPVRSGLVRDIVFDRRGDAWVLSKDTCLVRIGIEPGAEVRSYSLAGLGEGVQIRSLCPDTEGNLWMASYSAGLVRLRTDSGEMETFPYPEPSPEPDGNHFSKVLLRDTESLLVGTVSHGVLVFNLRTRTFSPYPGLDGEKVHFVHDLLIDDRGRLWVGAENGVHIDDHGSMTHLSHNPNDPYSLSDNAVFSLAQDREGGIWIGTYFGGVNYWSEYSSQFKKYYPVQGSNALLGKNISEFHESAGGDIWIGTEDAGLHRFHPETGHFENGFLPAGNIHAVTEIDGKLWVGSYGQGLFVLDPVGGGSYCHYAGSDRPGALHTNNIFAIYRDRDACIWIGTESGLYRYEASGGFVQVEPFLITGQVNDILQDFEGNLWLATLGSGIYRLREERWERMPIDLAEGADTQYISCIIEDRDHNLWFGSDNAGVFFYDHAVQAFTRNWSESDGLPNNMVYKLLEDQGGRIWGSTNHGLFCIDADLVRSYDHRAGLVCDQYNFKSGVRTGDGTLYFGGVKGFVSFSPEALRWPDTPSRIVFDRFLIFNDEVRPMKKGSPLRKSITRTDHITLRHRQNAFSIGFADLSFAVSGTKSYQYRMTGKGFDREWVDIDRDRFVSWSDLSPGVYRFDVRATPVYADMPETVKSLHIRILPPFWRTGWAYALYVLAVLAALGLLVWGILRKFRRRSKEALAEMERRKEKELYDAKIEFFTNITHEIRTPLTLISVPIEGMLEKTSPSSPIYEDLTIVQRNTDRLLTLVNQLLDFRRIGPGTERIVFRHRDVVPILRDTTRRFSPLLQEKGIRLEETYPDSLEAEIEPEIFIKMISNVLNNASKYADSRIGLLLEMLPGRFRLRISNDGERIPPEQAERIFEPFIKLHPQRPGSGIGLPFTRTLAATHGGRIFLDTEAPDTSFVLEFPLAQEHSIHLPDPPSEAPEPEKPLPETGEETSDGEEKKRILLVDDNEEFLAYLRRQLSAKYDVLAATDGQMALELLARETIDLVITDLSMPRMDGRVLCGEIKKDLSTSHIPVILLTAQTDLDTRIECIKMGADEFISKPFSPSYLEVRIDNLLTAREQLRKVFRQTPDVPVSTIAPSPADAEFLDRVTEIILSKLDHTDLDVNDIAESLCMSRATLYRKMKSVTELSPNEFIRLCRLKKAAELLAQREYRVNEIAYIVGFSSTSYFSKCFFRQFGVLPKDFGKE